MINNKVNSNINTNKIKKDQQGSAVVIALLVMALLMVFVALAVSRTASETIATSNDISETRSFSAAQASLENMTVNADQIFEQKITLNTQDLTAVKTAFPTGFTDKFAFQQNMVQTQTARIIDATDAQFQGLKAIRDEWELTSTAKESSTGVEVALKRKLYNDRVPIFQFGVFYDDDLEFHPGPRFDFGGRVHSNGSMFLMASTGLYFSSKVSARNEIVTDIARNGAPSTDWGQNVYIKNADQVYKQLLRTEGSALNTVVNGVNLYASNSDMPALYRNALWTTTSSKFQGNLLSQQSELKLPLKIKGNGGSNVDYIELIKRGLNVGDKFNDGTGSVSSPNVVNVTPAASDSIITTQERLANKHGIRISLANSRDRLPGCATATTNCGIQLDGTYSGDRGYQPLALTNGVQATRINGDRFYSNGKENWIKIELVNTNTATNVIETKDVTEDILSLGVTEPIPTVTDAGTGYVHLNATNSAINSRSIIKLQRFAVNGAQIKANSAYLTDYSLLGKTYNMVVADDATSATTDDLNPLTNNSDKSAYLNDATILNGTKTIKVAPFPITMFDTREGLYNDNLNTGTTYPNGVLPRNGVLSMIDIDVANFRKFLNGDFDTLLPTTTQYAASNSNISLKSTNIPESKGWVVYVSDRRGDFDFDGEYDMEDIYGNNDGTLQKGEDVNRNGTLQAEYTNEAPTYSNTVERDIAAVANPSYYRRGVRLINGQVLPGIYDSATPINTKGFTLASENGVYVQGNYNSTGVTSVGTPTPSTGYLPQDTSLHIPAAVIADAVSILSNSWDDTKSFVYPFTLSSRAATSTTVRFAMLSGDAISSKSETPNQGGGNPRMTGGVHNFKRFLENWGGDNLNYTGSLINLFNAHNSNGAFKCCNKVYSPPNRNWSFDVTFLDPNRIPPGTPFFQTIKLTGFQRINQ